MVKCANCGCQNIKGSKECTNCRCRLIFGGGVFHPVSFTKSQKFLVTLLGIVFLLIGARIVYDYLFNFYYIFSDIDYVILILYCTLGLINLIPGVTFLGGAYFLYFCVKNSLNSNGNDN